MWRNWSLQKEKTFYLSKHTPYHELKFTETAKYLGVIIIQALLVKLILTYLNMITIPPKVSKV